MNLVILIIILQENYKNELLKLFKDKAHHWYDAHASSQSSRADEKCYWCNVNKWMRNDYYYFAEEFSQDKRYTEEIT